MNLRTIKSTTMVMFIGGLGLGIVTFLLPLADSTTIIVRIAAAGLLAGAIIILFFSSLLGKENSK